MMMLMTRVGLPMLFVGLMLATAIADDGKPRLCIKGQPVFEDSFAAAEVSPNWTAAKGDWKIVDGALQGTELKADKHAASIRTDVDLPDNLVMQFDFMFDGGSTIHCSFNGQGHICRATITPDGYVLKGEKVKKDPEDKAVTVGQVQQKFSKGQWYTMKIEIAGEDFVAQVNDGPVAFGSHPKIAREKNNFGFPMAGASSKIDNIKIWSATRNPDWTSIKRELPANKIIPTGPPTPQQRFAILDKDKNGGLTLKEFIGNRPEDKRAAAENQFKRKDKDGNGSLSLSEFVPTSSGK